MTSTKDFYDRLAGMYHLIYPDWDKSISEQAVALDRLIKANWPDADSVLDVSCGIGTQAIGLSQMGYSVVGSDLSSGEVDRARNEAAKRALNIDFSVADMREAFERHQAEFDVVASLDNSVPHLLTDDDLLGAFRQFYMATRPGGGCIISVRDYAREDVTKRQIKPYGIRESDGVRWIVWQVWDPIPPYYQVSMYFTEDTGIDECRTHVMRTKYNPVTIDHLTSLLKRAGFTNIQRIDGEYFQPVLISHKSARQGGRQSP